MAYTYLPGEYAQLIDGNLGITLPVGAPRILIMGPAGRGYDYTPFNVSGNTLAQAVSQYGQTGGLVEQAFECREWGGQAMVLNRIGARPMYLQYVGGTGINMSERTGGGFDNGYRISPRYGGTEHGTRFGIAYHTSDPRLIIADLRFGVRVFDNGTGDPVDLGLFNINNPAFDNGTEIPGSNIGTYDASGYTAIAFNTCQASDEYMWFYAGDNGTDLGYMQLYEAIYKGFKSMEGIPFNYVACPSKATLDAPYSTSNIAATAACKGTNYPRNGVSYDKLGKVYIEDYDGRFDFYWDVNNDNKADYWSVQGHSSTSTIAFTSTSAGGHIFAAGDFHEANFAYLIAHNCYQITENDHFCQAAVPTEPPLRAAPEYMHRYFAGVLPVFSTDLAGNVEVSVNGSGLLGNKIMAGATDFRAKASYGGLIATTEGYIDGTELEDENEHKVDIGKYLSIISTPIRYTEVPWKKTGYYRISPAAYMGFRSRLGAGNPPTNKILPAAGIQSKNLLDSKLDEMVQCRYTVFKETTRGIIVVDAPTAARPDSDYQRQGSIEIVAAATDGLRSVAFPFIGTNMTAETEIALEKQMNEFMMGLKKQRILRDYQLRLVITEDDRILGQANVYVDIIAPFELRQITFRVALRRGT